MGDDDREEKKENTDFKNGPEKGEEVEKTLPEENLYSEIKALQEGVEAKKKEYDNLYDKYLRAVADFDNYKKRVAKEKVDIMTYGNEELIKELLHVIDNLERALEHSESSEEAGPIVEGIRLVYKQFLSCLEKFGVKPIDATKGDKFDPRYHQAIEYVESSEITPGMILSEMLKGYTLRDRLLRPSLVVVSKEKDESSPYEKSSFESESGYKAENPGSEEILELTDEDSDN